MKRGGFFSINLGSLYSRTLYNKIKSLSLAWLEVSWQRYHFLKYFNLGRSLHGKTGFLCQKWGAYTLKEAISSRSDQLWDRWVCWTGDILPLPTIVGHKSYELIIGQNENKQVFKPEEKMSSIMMAIYVCSLKFVFPCFFFVKLTQGLYCFDQTRWPIFVWKQAQCGGEMLASWLECTNCDNILPHLWHLI